MEKEKGTSAGNIAAIKKLELKREKKKQELLLLDVKIKHKIAVDEEKQRKLLTRVKIILGATIKPFLLSKKGELVLRKFDFIPENKRREVVENIFVRLLIFFWDGLRSDKERESLKDTFFLFVESAGLNNYLEDLSQIVNSVDGENFEEDNK